MSSPKRDKPCRQLGQLVKIFTFACGASAPLFRNAASPLSSSSSLRKRTWVEMSGRDTPKVPDSPQQRLLSITLSPIKALTVFMGSCSFMGVWQGSW